MIASTAVLALQSIPCDLRVGGTEPAKYPVSYNYISSTHTEHDVCFHLPGRENGSVKIYYFNGPEVDHDASQSEGHEFGYIEGKLADASFEEPDQTFQAIDAMFSPLEKPHWNACFRNAWTDWRSVMWQLAVREKVRRKV
jgi:hypothetical protein